MSFVKHLICERKEDLLLLFLDNDLTIGMLTSRIKYSTVEVNGTSVCGLPTQMRFALVLGRSCWLEDSVSA